VAALFTIAWILLLIAQLRVSRKWAFVPLLIGAGVFPSGVALEFGISFTVCHLVILVGITRALLTGALTISWRNPFDATVLLFCFWAMISILGHMGVENYNPVLERMKLVYNIGGGYFYCRAFIKTVEDFERLIQALAVTMIFLAIPMLAEKLTGTRYSWAFIEDTHSVSEVRGGKIRAAGPFGHAILAGSAGAATLALMIPLWRQHRKLAVWGIISCLVIVYSCASSGPILTAAAGLGAMFLWRWRYSIRWIRRMAIFMIIALHLLMNAPVWYLMSRVDLTGSSTGNHRAELITQALKHLDRWWFIGTDYTRDWMPHGIQWNPNHVDITNYYIKMGVIGGLPLLILFVAIIYQAYNKLGHGILQLREKNDPREFLFWGAGSFLFAHCVTFLSISYYDQSIIFFLVIIGATPALYQAALSTVSDQKETEPEQPKKRNYGTPPGMDGHIPVS